MSQKKKIFSFFIMNSKHSNQYNCPRLCIDFRVLEYFEERLERLPNYNMPSSSNRFCFFGPQVGMESGGRRMTAVLPSVGSRFVVLLAVQQVMIVLAVQQVCNGTSSVAGLCMVQAVQPVCNGILEVQQVCDGTSSVAGLYQKFSRFVMVLAGQQVCNGTLEVQQVCDGASRIAGL